MADHVYGSFGRDGVLFSYDVRVQQATPELLQLVGSVRSIMQYAPGGIAEAARGKAVTMLGSTLYDLHRRRSRYHLGASEDGSLTASIFAAGTVGPAYLQRLESGLRERLADDAFEHCMEILAATFANRP